MGQEPRNANCQQLVMSDLPVRGVLPDPDSTSEVGKNLYSSTNTLYRMAERFEQKLADEKAVSEKGN